MNTEKSIKLMKVIKSILPEHYNFDFGKPEIDEVIKRLQMWEDLKEKCGNCVIQPIEGELNFNDAIREIEQKYFPEPRIRKFIEVEILAENEDVIDELAKDIEEMNSRIFDKGKIRIVTTRWERR